MGNDRGKELKGKGKGREIKKAKERCKKEIRNLKRTENKTGKKTRKETLCGILTTSPHLQTQEIP